MKEIKSNDIDVTVTQWIDDKHQDSLWYDGTCAKFSYDNCDVYIVANGYIDATLLDTNDNIISETVGHDFYGDMSPYIENDIQLHDFIEDELLVLENNNWWEMFIDIDGDEYTSDVLGSVLLVDAIDEATANFYDYIED